MSNHMQEAYRIPNRQNEKRNAVWHIIIKMLKKMSKGIILKASKEKVKQSIHAVNKEEDGG